MSENETTLSNIFDKFKDDPEKIIFQFMKSGQSWGANERKNTCAKVSIAMPIDICSWENRNLGEISKYFGIVLFIEKEKVKNFIEENLKKDLIK